MAARKRIDPVSTPANGAHHGENRLSNLDPSKHYVWVDPNSDTGLPEYLGNGYQEVLAGADAPKLKGSRANSGEVMSWKGQVLVQKDGDEVNAERMQEQAKLDQLDARMLKSGALDDPMRGQVRLKVDPNAGTYEYTERG